MFIMYVVNVKNFIMYNVLTLPMQCQRNTLNYENTFTLSCCATEEYKKEDDMCVLMLPGLVKTRHWQ